MDSITTECLQRFENDGFVALPTFLAGTELDDLIANVDRFVREIVPQLPPEHAFYEDKRDTSSLKQIQCMGDYDSAFHALLTGRFRETAEFLLGRAVVPKNLQYFSKPPGTGKPTPPHQDGYYFMLDPCEAITLWLALDDVDEENGCVRYVHGSHQRGMREHSRTTTLGFSQGIVDYPTDIDEQHEVAVPASAGDLLAHHAMTIHLADGNRSSNRPRRALGFVYFGEESRVDVDARDAYQERLASEMKQQGRI